MSISDDRRSALKEGEGEEVPSLFARVIDVANHLGRMGRHIGHLGPRGPENGPPALVIPGFMSSDRTTLELRRFLARDGWRVHGWKNGQNLGAYEGLLDDLQRRLDEVAGEDKALLVGWSLGGVMARELARSRPDRVRAVVTLASPFSGHRKLNNVWKQYELVAGHPVDDPPVPQSPDKPPVPTMSIVAEKDGLVAQRAQIGLREETDRVVTLPCGHMRIGKSRPMLRRVIKEIHDFVPH
ncbi:alpha/beta fold hydrolase [Sphingomicrobium astaxanthinifaciens]|uniref:alpha/beta fold hydrolase n=1 Tax=Sphingomicrobium astaxanthinifaciens TaxID=1227949 RepID=UPI001FCBB873|nr:alpha/beta hydrolase [Sphingomicrobium astaxanthinifaciens]MCJ7421046.1 alpha/beta hydrolase [Sphingomicrobium astaxanthinifaciens]